MIDTIKIVALALMLVSSIYLVACTETKTDVDNSAENDLQILSHSITVHKFSGDVLQSTAAVKGKARNVGNSTLSTVSITVKYYDSDGNLIDTSSAVNQNLGAGQTWDFFVQSVGPDAWKIVNYDIVTSAEK